MEICRKISIYLIIVLLISYSFLFKAPAILLAAATDTPAYSSMFPINAGNFTFVYGGTHDVAFDSSGNAYIAGYTFSQVAKLNSSGDVTATWTDSHLNVPYGIAVDSTNGWVYVSENIGQNITKFDTNGNYILTIGSAGSGSGQFGSNSPRNITVDSSGNIYAADSGNNRIIKFNSSGTVLFTFGSGGTGNGQFSIGNGPYGVAVDSTGNIFVADYGNNRIQKFNSAGVYQSQFGTLGSGAGQFNHPTSVSLDTTGNIWVSDQNNNRVQEFNSSGTYITEIDGSSGGTVQGSIYNPWNAHVDASGNLWVSDNKSTLNKYNSSLVFQHSWGSLGSEVHQLNGPYMLTQDSAKNFYISDMTNNRIVVLDSSGNLVRTFGTFGSGNGQLSGPAGIAIGPVSGNVIVADSGNNRIEIFTSTGTYVSQFNGSLGAGGIFNNPDGITVDSSENIYIADTFNYKIQVFDKNGTFVRQFGSFGTANGQFQDPLSVRLDASGNLWVVDGVNNNMQKFSKTGTYISQFGSTGTANGQFSSAFDMGFDSNGYIYVVDDNFTHAKVQKFDSTGAYLAQWGSGGMTGANSVFDNPEGIYVDSTDNFYVADAVRIQKFAYAPAATPTPTVAASTTQISSGGSSGSPQNNNNPIAPVTAPNLYQIDRKGSDAVLWFTPVDFYTNAYSVSYGTNKNKLDYLVNFTHSGSGGAINYTIKNLNKNKIYYFKIRALNANVPGPWSNIRESNANEIQPTPSPLPISVPLPPIQQLQQNITLSLVDQNGTGISGASVSVTQTSTANANVNVLGVTDVNGNITTSLEPGNYVVTASKDEAKYEVPINVSPKDTQITVNIKNSTSKQSTTFFSPKIVASISETTAKTAATALTVTLIVNVLISLVNYSKILFGVYANSGRSFIKYPFDLATALGKFSFALLTDFFGKQNNHNNFVFDAESGTAVKGAYVIFYSISGNLKTAFTNSMGNFDVLLRSDDYKIRIESMSHVFPSKKVGKNYNFDYPHIYLFDETIKVSKDESSVKDLAIPADPVNKLSGYKYFITKFNNLIQQIFIKYGVLLAIFMTLASIYTTVYGVGNRIILAVSLVYLLTLIFKKSAESQSRTEI